MGTSSSSGFNFGRVLVIVIPIAAIAAAIVGYTYMTGAGGGGLGGISVVDVKYKLMFRDKPLADALVMAYSQDRPGVVGLGTSDKDGVVTLETDNGEGQMLSGLVAGKHKLTVRGAMPSAMGGPTRVYTPATYDDPSKTTLSVEVKAGSSGGEPVTLVIEDDGTGMSEEEIAEGMESYRKQLEALPEAQKMFSGPRGGGPGDGGPAGGGPGPGGPGGGEGRPERPEVEAPATEGSAPAESTPAEAPAAGGGQN